VKRCGKEKLSYRKEADMQKEKVEKMKAEGREEIEIRKMNEVRLSSVLIIVANDSPTFLSLTSVFKRV